MAPRRLLAHLGVLAGVLVVTVVTPASAVTPGLPNATWTPGAPSAKVTQKNIHSTICVAGYTKTVRPPSSYTSALKRSQLASGYALNGDHHSADYEEDHLIPLEVGGSPASVKNLWPEPRWVTWSAARKDRLENAVHAAICAGHLSLAAGQAVFAKNWITAYPSYVH